MPDFTTPASNSEDARLFEFNSCHSPATGEFCTGNQTMVGITSARPGKPAGQVFRDMHEFEGKLLAIKSVTDVKVQPGLGAWEGGSEPTWVVSYRGNGKARRLLAETGKRYDQDAVLVMSGPPPGGGSPVADFAFEGAVTMKQRQGVHAALVAAGLGGWTWFKKNGRTVLRSACVPQWGGEPMAHMAAAKRISKDLLALGFKHATRARRVQVEVMERGDGEHGYDKILGKVRRSSVPRSVGQFASASA